MMWIQASICVVSVLFPLFVEPRYWPDLRTETLVFLSILLGAVLFRLGRGIPSLAVESARLVDVQRLTEAFKVVGYRLVWVFAVTAIAILLVILNKPLLSISQDWPWLVRVIGCATVLMITLSVVRAVVMVMGDLDIIRQQAELLKRSAEACHAAESKEALDKAERLNPLASSEGYGGIEKPIS